MTRTLVEERTARVGSTPYAVDVGHAPDTLFDAILHFAETTPNRPALIDPANHRSVTYRQLLTELEELAGRLSFLGIGEGTPVVAVMPRSIALIVTVLAVSRVGGWAIAYLSPRNLEAAVEVAREALKPTFFITDLSAAERSELTRGSELWLAFEELASLPVHPRISYTPNAGTILYLNESSGSRSKPKLVPATHGAVLANTAACVETFGITEADVHLCTFASHIHESFARALMTGGTAVLMADSVADNQIAYLDALVRYGVTCLMSNATTYAALTALSTRRANDFPLRLAESGGIPTPETLKPRLMQKFGARLMPVWGSTETAGVAIAPSGDHWREGSVGKPLPGYTVTVVDESGYPAPPGRSGELIVSGAAVAPYYVSGPTGPQLQGGTFRTGDRAWIDADGWIFINGRIADEFKVAGVVVSAETIERALARSDHVKMAAVLPFIHPLYGYVPVALIVPRGDEYHSLTKKAERRVIREIIGEAERHLEYPFLELPTRIRWVWDLPRTAAKGIVDRRLLPEVFDAKPLGSTKVRLPALKEIRLAVKAAKGASLWRLFIKNPRGFVRLVLMLLKGDKNK